MPEGVDDALREAAAHRGLKLVRSRKRKAGVGDYGRYGLTDAGGKELFGFGPDGLTAIPAEIRDYLRQSEVSTWAQSAEVTPDQPKPSARAPKATEPADGAERQEPNPTKVDDHLPRHRARKARNVGRREQTSPASHGRIDNPAAPESLTSELAVEPEPKPEPVFEIRAATDSDIEAIARLIGPTVNVAVLGRRLDELRRAGGGVLMAKRGHAIGFLAWHSVLSMHEQPIGRVTLLIVDEDERRRGTGTALVAAAATAMVERGCGTMEAMSDIDVRNVNGFFRALKFERKSYRFVSDTEPPSTNIDTGSAGR